MAERPVALITGGAKRIGRAIAEDLAANGFDLIVHANASLDDAKVLCAELGRRHGGWAHAIQADLTDIDDARALIDKAVLTAGPMNVLVNNASMFEPDEIGALDQELWAQHFALHVQAPSVLAEAFARQLPRDTQGLVVNIIDQRVWRLTPNFYSYTLSKSALWTATRTMAQALAPRVRVNAIGPGPTLANNRQDDDDFSEQVGALPLGYGPKLAEFGATIRYLWAMKSITGQMIALDGGQHLAWQTPDVTGMAE